MQGSDLVEGNHANALAFGNDKGNSATSGYPVILVIILEY